MNKYFFIPSRTLTSIVTPPDVQSSHYLKVAQNYSSKTVHAHSIQNIPLPENYERRVLFADLKNDEWLVLDLTTHGAPEKLPLTVLPDWLRLPIGNKPSAFPYISLWAICDVTGSNYDIIRRKAESEFPEIFKGHPVDPD